MREEKKDLFRSIFGRSERATLAPAALNRSRFDGDA
jgi:hypothetical protein